MKNNYPDNEKDRKKALTAQHSFYNKINDNRVTETYTKISRLEFAARNSIKDNKSAIEILINQGQLTSAVIEYLHNANWHLSQALKIIDEVKKS